MTHLDQMIADSIAQSPDTVVHQLASEVVRLRSEIADLKRGGVVVPEPSIDDDEAILKSLPAGYRNWWSHARPVSMGKPEVIE